MSEAGATAAERPPNQTGILDQLLSDPALQHLHFDISWSEVAKYIMSSPQALARAAEIVNRFPDRFLFGTDEVAPKDQAMYLRVYRQYDPLWR